MAAGSSGFDPARLRVSDADRHQVAEILREAAGEGRLDIEELDQRLESTYAAKVYADLVPITADLPTGSGLVSLDKPQPPVAPRPPSANLPVTAIAYSSSVTVFGGVDRKGLWLVPDQHTAFAMMGAIELDLREAQFADREVTINANVVMGAIDVIVNAHTHVIVDGIGIMGAFEQSRDKVEPELTADSQVVRVKGFALMGAVSVIRKGPPRVRRKKLWH